MSTIVKYDKWLWHEIDETPRANSWIVCADKQGHYFSGQWQNDGKGFDFTITLKTPLGLSFDVKIDFEPIRWAYIHDNKDE